MKVKSRERTMKKRNRQGVLNTLLISIKKHPFLFIFTLLFVGMSVVSSLLPPLALAKFVDALNEGEMPSISIALLYFATLLLEGIFASLQDTFLIIFGQKMIHSLRGEMSKKLTKLEASSLLKQKPGELAARFSSDVDAVETLFTSGVISMFADVARLISILVIIGFENLGLMLIVLLILPPFALFTRYVQKKTLASQLENRKAIAMESGQVPESIHNIRTIHLLGLERFMQKHYEEGISKGYQAVEKTNFYDSIYSPIVIFLNALIVGIVMLLSASGNKEILSFFGMSVGTSVAVISYITKLFTPIESLGMEIQTIQSGMAGVKRIDTFLKEKERALGSAKEGDACGDISFSNVYFGYDDKLVLKDFNLEIKDGEQVTFVGRTGAGKSTIFRLLLGLYSPNEGEIKIDGMNPKEISDSNRRKTLACVEQHFSRIQGNILSQITLDDPTITEEMAIDAAKLVGLDEAILSLPNGYDTKCSENIFSQGEWQLLSIARAISSNPKVLLLDEITANLDSKTENEVLDAIKRASKGRTLISISHRTYENLGGRKVEITTQE